MYLELAIFFLDDDDFVVAQVVGIHNKFLQYIIVHWPHDILLIRCVGVDADLILPTRLDNGEARFVCRISHLHIQGKCGLVVDLRCICRHGDNFLTQSTKNHMDVKLT